jgi:hypothetical protein
MRIIMQDYGFNCCRLAQLCPGHLLTSAFGGAVDTLQTLSLCKAQAREKYGEKLLTASPNMTAKHFLYESGNTPSLRAAAMDQWLFGLVDFHVRDLLGVASIACFASYPAVGW